MREAVVMSGAQALSRISTTPIEQTPGRRVSKMMRARADYAGTSIVGQLQGTSMTAKSADRAGHQPFLFDRPDTEAGLEQNNDRYSHLPAGTHDPPYEFAEVNFICPHCAAFYEAVRRTSPPRHGGVTAGIVCLTCAGPLAANEAEIEFDYFLWRKRDCGWTRVVVSAD